MKDLSLPTKLYLAAIYLAGFWIAPLECTFRHNQKFFDGDCFIPAGIFFPDL